MKASRQKIGAWGEEIAADFLFKKNYQIIKSNFRTKLGEIDIVAIDNNSNEIVFVEVKTRRAANYCWPEEAVTEKKKNKMIRAANIFLASFCQDKLYRFDIIAIEVFITDRRIKITQYKNCIWQD